MRGKSCRKRLSRFGGSSIPTTRSGPSSTGRWDFSRIETRRFLARQQRRGQLTEEAVAVLEQEMEQASAEDFGTAIERHLATYLGKLPEKHRRIIKDYYHGGRSPEWLSEDLQGPATHTP